MNAKEYFGDREILNDLLLSERQISSCYNAGIGECTSQTLAHILENILNETHQMQYEIWNSMTKRGWCKVRLASSQEIEMLKQKSQQAAEEL